MLKELTQEIKATMGIYESRSDHMYGLLAEFENPGTLYEAAKGVREAGYKHFDTHSPFPIHGMDRAMGLGNSKVGVITLGPSCRAPAEDGTYQQSYHDPSLHTVSSFGRLFFLRL